MDAGRVAEGQMENDEAERWLGIKCQWLFFAQRCKNTPSVVMSLRLGN